jgi:hypothetical protein
MGPFIFVADAVNEFEWAHIDFWAGAVNKNEWAH